LLSTRFPHSFPTRRSSDLLFPWQRIQCFPLAFRKLGDLVIEAGDADAKVLVVEAGKKLGENRQRIGNRSPVDAGMEIALGAGKFNLVVVQRSEERRVGKGG